MKGYLMSLVLQMGYLSGGSTNEGLSISQPQFPEMEKWAENRKLGMAPYAKAEISAAFVSQLFIM